MDWRERERISRLVGSSHSRDREPTEEERASAGLVKSWQNDLQDAKGNGDEKGGHTKPRDLEPGIGYVSRKGKRQLQVRWVVGHDIYSVTGKTVDALAIQLTEKGKGPAQPLTRGFKPDPSIGKRRPQWKTSRGGGRQQKPQWQPSEGTCTPLAAAYKELRKHDVAATAEDTKEGTPKAQAAARVRYSVEVYIPEGQGSEWGLEVYDRLVAGLPEVAGVEVRQGSYRFTQSSSTTNWKDLVTFEIEADSTVSGQLKPSMLRAAERIPQTWRQPTGINVNPVLTTTEQTTSTETTYRVVFEFTESATLDWHLNDHRDHFFEQSNSFCSPDRSTLEDNLGAQRPNYNVVVSSTLDSKALWRAIFEWQGAQHYKPKINVLPTGGQGRRGQEHDGPYRRGRTEGVMRMKR